MTHNHYSQVPFHLTTTFSQLTWLNVMQFWGDERSRFPGQIVLPRLSTLGFNRRLDLVHQLTHFVSVDPTSGAFLDTDQTMSQLLAHISPACCLGIKRHHFTSHQYAALSSTGDRVGVGCPRVFLHPRLRVDTRGAGTCRGKNFEVCEPVRVKPDND